MDFIKNLALKLGISATLLIVGAVGGTAILTYAATCTGTNFGGTGICYPTTIIDGYVLMGNSSGGFSQVSSTTFAGTPAGSSGQLQYNASGTFGGVSTTTASCTGGASCTDFTIIGSSPISISSSATSQDPFPGNATTTKLTFSGGLLSLSSTTIGNGTATGGLTVSGNSTTTGDAYFGGATSTFIGALQLGSTAANHFLTLTAPAKTYSTSVSVGGAANMTFTNANAGLYLYTSNTASDGALFSADCNTATMNTQCIRIQGIASDQSTVNLQGGPTGLGVLKISSLQDQGINGSLISLDASTNSNTGQGLFIKSNSTGKVLNLVDSGSNTLFVVDPGGNSTTTGTAYAAIASSTKFFSAGLSSCTGGSNALTWTGGTFGCNAGLSTSAYPFPLSGNATSSLTQFNGGLTALASSTIGNGAQTGGLTVSGGATTTGNAYFGGTISLLGTILNNKYTATVCASGCDYTSIDTAVNAVAASSTVYIKNGTYSIGTTGITVPAAQNISLIGESMDGVQIVYTGGGTALAIGDSSADTRNVRIENITIRGTSSGTRGFSFVRIKNSTIRNLRATGFSSTINPGQAFRLDGTGSYTGDNAFYYLYCSTSEVCLNLAGTAVNSNHFYGFTFRTTGTGTSVAVKAAQSNGNTFYGGLVGGSSIGFNFTSTGDENLVDGTYCEGNTTCVQLDSGAAYNIIRVVDVESNTTVVSDSGTGNNVSYNGSDSGGKTYFNGGYFGIGTTSPYAPLSVVGPGGVVADHYTATTTTATSTFAGALQIGGSAGDNALKITAARSYPSSNSTGGMMRLTNTLNSGSALGIYTNFGSGATNDLAIFQNDNAANDRRVLQLLNDGVANALLANCTNTNMTADCVDITSSDTALTALGVKSPTLSHGVLKITTATSTTNTSANASASAISLVLQNAAQGIYATGGINDVGGIGSSTGKFLQFRNYNNQYVGDWQHDGPISIWSPNGTASAMLDITATTTSDLGTGTLYDYVRLTSSPTATKGNIFTITNAGNVGIGSTTPTAKLGVQGTVMAQLTTFTSGDGAVCQQGAGGFLTFDAGVSSCTVSSKYVKSGIEQTALGQAMKRIKALTPVSFIYKDTGKPDLGLIAEDSAEVDSRYAQYAEQERDDAGHHFNVGDPVAINWSAVTADLVKVVQGQQAEIEVLAQKSGGMTDTAKRSAEENWEWGFMGLFFLGLVYQGAQIRKLKKDGTRMH